ncbi:MAG TPA: hypothetical protein VJP86_18065 [Vicinamibacterales bacterium]|nr:hypothetical protein [Vicinamibacterales bacterium]
MSADPVAQPPRGESFGRRLLELVTVSLSFAALTAAFTYPLITDLGGYGYKLGIPGDSQFSVWNVAWVARALIIHPLNVFDANIFYPERGALVFSETNFGAGLLGVPAYLLTGNAYVTHNSVLLLAFTLNGITAYYLARYLAGDRRAAAIAAICFAYCPYMFGHLPHIQLLMASGIPLSLLAFHRLADRPSAGRGLVLGVAVSWQAISCAYYAVFVALLIGWTIVLAAFVEGRWRDPRFWRSLSIAGLLAFVVLGGLYLPYFTLQREAGFARTLENAEQFSANWPSYLASSAIMTAWIHPLLPKWVDVLFPGMLATIAGVAGAFVAWRSGGRDRYHAVLYGTIAIGAFWLSFGPRAGLYAIFYRIVPPFSFLRAPSRFGMLVALALSMLAAVALARFLARRAMPGVTTALVLTIAIASRVTPIPLTPTPGFSPAYQVLASAPDGAVVELPIYSRQARFYRTQYMLASTVHWKPLVNAYSDYSPPSFSDRRDMLSYFPTRESLQSLASESVRYAVFHLSEYPPDEGLRQRLEQSLEEFGTYLRPLYRDEEVWLYEILGAPE